MRIWYENKTINGFTIVADRKITCNIDWTASFQPTELSLQPSTDLPECFVDNDEEYGVNTNFEILKGEGFIQ